MAAAAVLGDNIRTHRAYLASVEERATRLEGERNAQAAIAAAAERTRIAERCMTSSPTACPSWWPKPTAPDTSLIPHLTRPDAAMTTVAETGRGALTEMNRLLGVLRATPVEPGLAPQPGVDQLDALIARTESAGLPVTMSVQGSPVSLSPGLSLTVYRIVQEGADQHAQTCRSAGQGHRSAPLLSPRRGDRGQR